jgi:hypothetical protein
MPVREGWRFDRAPEADTDEDGERAFVAITAATQTPADALAWLAEHVEQIGWSPEQESLDVGRAEFDGIYCNIDAGIVPALHDALALRSLIVSGRVQAWWRFEVFDARDQVPDFDFDERLRIRTEEAEAEQRRRVEEWGAPRWWHARVRWAARLKRWGSRLDPKDRTSAYITEAGQFTIVENLRQPKDAGG